MGDETDSVAARFVYRRPVLKLSGEMLAGDGSCGLKRATFQSIARRVVAVQRAGVQVSIVVGGGNIFRGGRNEFPEIPQTTADDMGMLATLINALALREYIAALGAPATVLSAIEAPKIAERFTARLARRLLGEGHVLVLAAGTGNPFFTTDTAAALRAAEIGADVLLKATNVDGVYSDDPRRNRNAVKFTVLDYQRVVSENLKVMDTAAVAICRDAGIPIIVFDLKRKDSITLALQGKPVGTFVGGKR
jgi:uridylate kinase